MIKVLVILFLIKLFSRKSLLIVFSQDLFLENNKDFLACSIAFTKRCVVIGINIQFPLSVIFWNQSITFDVFLYWLQCNFSLTVLWIFSTTTLATFPSSLLAGFISQHLGLISKFSYGLLLLCRLVCICYLFLGKYMEFKTYVSTGMIV